MPTRGFKNLLLVFILTCLSSWKAQAQGNDDQKLPDYILACYRDDPKLSECVRSCLYGVIRKLVHGIPELDIPPIEPLFKEKIEAFDVAGFNLKVTNVTIWGISKMKYTWNSASIKTKIYAFDSVADTLQVQANYELTGFFFGPVHAAGTINVIGRKIEFRVDTIIDVLPRSGVEYVAINDLKVKSYVTDGSLWISNLGPFEGAINQLLNNRINVRFIINRLTPTVDEAVGYILQKFSNRIFNTVPYDNVLLKGTGPVSTADVKLNEFEKPLLRYKNKTFFDRVKNTFE